MGKEDLEYIMSTMEYGLNNCSDDNENIEHHYNMFSNAINLVHDELKIKKMKEGEILDKKTDEYLEDGINWCASKNEAIIYANKSSIARGDVEQLASDSFQEGWFAASRFLKSKK